LADGIVFDKTSYNVGDVIRATITLAARTKSDVLSYATAVGNLTATTTIKAAGTLTDSLGKTWTLVSDDGTVAVYTATA
jgi:hypothetical protein